MNTLTNGHFNALQATLRGQLLQANDAGYDSARAVWNAMIDRHPALIVRCAGTADVSIAPTIIMGTIFRFIAFTIPFDSKRAGHFWPAQPAE